MNKVDITTKEIIHIVQHFSGTTITNETAKDYAESLLYKLKECDDNDLD